MASRKHSKVIKGSTHRKNLTKKHGKAIKGFTPETVVALLQAAFDAGERHVEAINRGLATRFLTMGQYGGVPLTEQTRGLLEDQKRAFQADVETYQGDLDMILDGVDPKARQLFLDTIAPDNMTDEQDQEEAKASASLAALLGLGTGLAAVGSESDDDVPMFGGDFDFEDAYDFGSEDEDDVRADVG